MKKRIVSLLMALLMTLSLLPAAAWAEDADSIGGEGTLAENQEASEASQTLTASESQLAAVADTPAVCAASSTDTLTALRNAGFAKPELMGTNPSVGFDVPCWSNYPDLCSLDWYNSTGEATLTLNAASSEAWSAAYQQSVTLFGNTSAVLCVVPYYAPGLAYDDSGNWSSDACYYSFCMTQDSDEALNFANHYEDQTMYGNNGAPLHNTGRGVTIADVNTTRGTITSTADATYYYMVVWYGVDDEGNDYELAKYALKINIRSESFLHSTSGKTVDEMLSSAGYKAPDEKYTAFKMPVGLVEGIDYTYSYSKSTDQMTVKLLPGNPAHWQQAFETLLIQYDFEDACDWFGVTAGFTRPTTTTATKYVCPYFTSQDDSGVGAYINGTYANTRDWEPSGTATASTHPFGAVTQSADGTVTMTVPQGSTHVRNIVVWANSSKTAQYKHTYTLSIEVDEEFTVQWNNKPLDERLAYAGFTYPTMGTRWTKEDTGDEDYGYFYLEASKGLAKNTNYTCNYDHTTGTLTINVLDSTENWKAAYLNSIISDAKNVALGFNISFSPARENVDLYASTTSQEDMLALLNGTYTANETFYYENLNIGYCGNGFSPFQIESKGDNTTIRVEEGSQEELYVVVWTEPGTDTVVAKYMLKVVINVASSSNCTVPTPEIRDLDDSDNNRITIDKTNLIGGNSSWNIISRNGQLAFMPATGCTLKGILDSSDSYAITTFTISAPEGYTLQSYYIQQFRDGSNMENLSPEQNQAFEVDVFDNLNGSTTTIVGGTLRYTLRWSSNDSSKPDLVEKLNVRIGDLPLGKTTTTGDSNKINITDMQNMYEYMTQEQKNTTDADSVDEKLATYDVNLDGSVNVYDFQRLYEAVSLNDGKLV